MKYLIYIIMPLLVVLYGCGQNSGPEAGITYTCPMPEDSVFSDKPGNCPKCGMKLVELVEEKITYTCPMPEDSVFSDKPGNCPKCGMKLVPMTGEAEKEKLELNALLKPTNEFVVASMPVIAVQSDKKDISIQAYGKIDYDTRQIGNISARISGRIEKLYVRYKYQKITKGQKVMDIYSPELMEAQQNLLFLIKNDASNKVMVNAARQKLLLLGMTEEQLNKIIKNGKPDYAVTVYSNYSGHIHEGGITSGVASASGSMSGGSSMGSSTVQSGGASGSVELALKEGMYVQKGQVVFSVYDPDQSWVLLSIFAEDVSLIEKGQIVKIIPEVKPEKAFSGTIGFIEPFFREGTKTLTARVYFDNSQMNLPIGSQVKAEILSNGVSGNWLPEKAVLSLGLTKVVFKKAEGGFTVNKVSVGDEANGYVRILDGLSPTDSVAKNAQYLMDSESFIRTKNN